MSDLGEFVTGWESKAEKIWKKEYISFHQGYDTTPETLAVNLESNTFKIYNNVKVCFRVLKWVFQGVDS